MPVDVSPVALRAVTDKDEVATIVKAVVRVMEAWDVSNDNAAALFDVSSTTWSRMKSGTFSGSLDQDKVTRASLLVGIFKGLRLLFNGPLTYGWPGHANRGEPYQGRTPIDYMRSGGIPAMADVRQHIDALRGGA